MRTAIIACAGIGMLTTVSPLSAAVVQTPSYDTTSRTAYAVSDNDLLHGLTPQPTGYTALTSTTADFSIGNINDASNSNLDGSVVGANGSTDYSVLFDLAAAPLGFNVSSITVTSNGADNRVNQNVSIFYSVVGSSAFTKLADVVQSPNSNVSGTFSLRTVITEDAAAHLASGVDAIRFDVKAISNANQSNSRHTVYAEFDVAGTAVPEPSAAGLASIATLALARRRRGA